MEYDGNCPGCGQEQCDCGQDIPDVQLIQSDSQNPVTEENKMSLGKKLLIGAGVIGTLGVGYVAWNHYQDKAKNAEQGVMLKDEGQTTKRVEPDQPNSLVYTPLNKPDEDLMPTRKTKPTLENKLDSLYDIMGIGQKFNPNDGTAIKTTVFKTPQGVLYALPADKAGEKVVVDGVEGTVIGHYDLLDALEVDQPGRVGGYRTRSGDDVIIVVRKKKQDGGK
ncbi:MAG: hypothetical protein Q7R56_02655 [Nanoarchaeota archaeon]|nr:hypothetical protein [Nanoarchaeota archaeon]